MDLVLNNPSDLRSNVNKRVLYTPQNWRLNNEYKCLFYIYYVNLKYSIAQNTPTASLQRGKTPPNECPGFNTKKSDGEGPVMLELWRMRSASSLASLPGPLWPGVVALDKGPIYGLNRTKPCFFHYTDFCI